jgi:hypothetical protein
MWECKKCREQIEDSFEVCWSCGASKDGIEDPTFLRADEAAAGEATSDHATPPAGSHYRAAQRDVGETTADCPTPPPAITAGADAALSRKGALATCPKCGLRKVISGVWVLDRDGDMADKSLSVRLDRNPEAWIFKRSEIVELRANVCGSCGHAELYATNPAALLSAYEDMAEA